MESRSRKRDELSDQIPSPSDKRVCSTNSSLQSHQTTPMNSSPDCEMEATSSSASVSGRSEGDVDVNTDSDNGLDEDNHHENTDHSRRLRDYYRRRSVVDADKIRKILSSLKEEAGPGSQLAGLTELCEVLSFCTEELPTSYSELLAPVLVGLAKEDSNPEIMLLAVRCITYLCDAFFESSVVFVRHEVVPALSARLMNIEYLDVAEQCLQALEKISVEHPVVCLEAGVIMAALSYIDFFSTSIQRVALSTVVNICQKLPSNQTSSFMEAVPILCNLLQYEDQKLVENVATCLIKIVDRVKNSSEMLDVLCKHGLIHRATHLLELNGRSPLSQSVYTGLIGLLCKLASGSVDAFRTLLELNISSTLKHILSSYDIARGMTSINVGGEHCNQVHEFMKLLNELLPCVGRNCENDWIMSDKEKTLRDHPELLRQFGVDILPVLIQVVSAGVNLYVCYCCLSVINKLVYFSGPDMLLEFVKDTNISSFLAAAFTRKDHHVLILVLEIVENVMTKLPDVFLNAFIKEGVVYAIDALLVIPETCPESSSPTSSSMQLSSGSSQMPATRNVPRCLCYAFENEQSPSSRSATCKLEEDSVYTLAKRIRDSYFATESHSSRMGLTETLEKLRNLCALLTDGVVTSMNKDTSVQQEENLFHILGQIMTVLSAGEYMSTFEFIESGIVKSLVTYLSNAHYMKGKVDSHGYQSNFGTILDRLERFARFSLSSTSQNWEGMPITVLIKKLQSSLSSLEDFPVILSNLPKPRNTYANIPSGRGTLNPCLRVLFVREEGERDLCDYASEVVSIEPYSTLSDIEKFLLPKVTQKAERPAKVVRSTRSEDQSVINGCKSDLADAQNDYSNLSSPTSGRAILGETCVDMGHSPVTVKENPEILNIDTTLKADGSSDRTTSKAVISSKDGKRGDCTIGSHESAPTKLTFYLKGKQIDRELTLYQEILQQKVKEEHEVVIGPGFWSTVYQVTYGKAAEPKNDSQECFNDLPFSSVQNNQHLFWQNVAFFRTMLVSELKCGIEKSSPTYEILFLLRILEGVNRFAFHLISQGQKCAYSKGEMQDLDDLVVTAPRVPSIEFVNTKLTEKLEQQLRDPLAMSSGSMPSWCSQLMLACPYLFGFEAKRKYLQQVMLSSLQVQPQSLPQAVNDNSISPTHRNSRPSGLRKKKFRVSRSQILDSAAKMMDQHARQKNILEVEYNEEVGSGLGPTMEFYTLVSQEFQKVGLGIWRGDHSSFTSEEGSTVEESRLLLSPLGFFPRPLSHVSNGSNELKSVEVMKKFVLLGQIVAKTLQDGRVLDLLFSKAFYKLILDQELDVYDIHSIDPELGRTLLEFEALIERRNVLHSVSGTQFESDLSFRNTKIEDLWLDFTLPGYPDYMLSSKAEHKMVNIINLEEYVSSIVDATVKSGISRQVEAFKSGFNQVFPIKNLKIFSEEELERLVCGEQDAWTSIELLEHVKFDHGYTASSEAIINLLEIIQDFDYEKKRAFLQFVTGAPRLPPGGLAALNPQLTVVRKHCSEWVDGDLPSVMTCANYLKLPPYSTKERMRERLLFAITEGQGSFHLS